MGHEPLSQKMHAKSTRAKGIAGNSVSLCLRMAYGVSAQQAMHPPADLSFAMNGSCAVTGILRPRVTQ